MEKNKGARGKGVRFRDESAPTLADLGISQVQSHRWQKIARIPMGDFEAFIGAKMSEGKELTSLSVLRLASELNRQTALERKVVQADQAPPQRVFSSGELASTVVVDPPWDALGHRTEELLNLPIPTICARNAHLYLCVTNNSLEHGFELLRVWGFRYVNCLTWCKAVLEGGFHYRSSTEHFLFGVRGNLELKRDDVGTWFQWPWGSIHREKPDRFYELVMSCSPGPYVVLFSKRQRPGWICSRLNVKTVDLMQHEVNSRSSDAELRAVREETRFSIQHRA
jgi:N6-adenosine-specific RNA methylase IME4